MTGFIQERLIRILYYLPVALIALPFHEAAHAFSAHLLGDDTAKRSGRLTLNPLKHLDPIGFLCAIFVGFGWARPVPVNMYNFKKPRLGFALTSLAGPISNFLLALVSMILMYAVYVIPFPASVYSSSVFAAILLFFQYFSQINIMLAVFNLIPVPPLDGSRLVSLVLPERIYYKILQYERYIWLGLMALLLIGVFDKYIYGVTGFIFNGMSAAVGAVFNLFI